MIIDTAVAPAHALLAGAIDEWCKGGTEARALLETR